MSSADKRILYVYQGTYPWEVRVEKFCDSLQQHGFECMVLCRWDGEADRESTHHGTTIRRVGFQTSRAASLPTSMNPMWRRAIREAVAEFHPNLIIAREMLIASACADAAARRIPMVLDMAEHYPAAMRSWKKYRQGIVGPLLVHSLGVPDLVEKSALRSSDAVLLVCEENRERLSQVYGYDRDRMHLVHNTPPLSAAEGVRLGTRYPPTVFSYQGWITRERGVERLLQAFDEAVELGPSPHTMQLIIAGGGESMSDVQQIHSGLRHRSNVSLMGEYKQEQRQDINSQTDIGVIPFDQDEFRNHTIPNKLFDYMMTGKPVIVSQCAPMARIVHETGCGIVVNVDIPNQLRDAIHHMRDLDLEFMSSAGRQAALQTYHWDVDARVLVQCIKSML